MRFKSSAQRKAVMAKISGGYVMTTGRKFSVTKLHSDDLSRMKEIRDDLQEKKSRLEELEDNVKELEEADESDSYDDMLDDSYGEVKIAGYSYESSRALKELDPVAYRQGLLEYNDGQISDINEEINDIKSDISSLQNEKAEISKKIVVRKIQ